MNNDEDPQLFAQSRGIDVRAISPIFARNMGALAKVVCRHTPRKT
jgi:hypothetical protein